MCKCLVEIKFLHDPSSMHILSSLGLDKFSAKASASEWGGKVAEEFVNLTMDAMLNAKVVGTRDYITEVKLTRLDNQEDIGEVSGPLCSQPETKSLLYNFAGWLNIS